MKKALTIVFFLFLGGVFVLNLLLPDRTFSPMENRNLAEKPVFGWECLFSGQFGRDMEEYVTDQFPFRDGLMAAKATLERLTGKKESHGVYLLPDRLIERLDAPDEDRVRGNIRAVNRFCAQAGVPVYMTLLPTAQEIWRDRLPAGAPTYDEAALIRRCETEVQAPLIDTLSALRAHADEEIFYRTDHHWTSLGACFGADALLRALGLGSVDPDAFEKRVVTEDFCGTLYSKSGARHVKPDSITLFVTDEGIEVTKIAGGISTPGALYDLSFLEKKDKYALFMGGNQPLAVIRTAHDGPKLLLVRDSYADSEVPFLLNDFSEIHLVDLRYYKAGLPDYIAENAIDLVVISYSLRNFITDGNLAFLS